MSTLLSIFGWAFLPKYVTSILQKVYYGITITAGEPWPQPSSPRFERHRRRIHIFVVTSYLLYTLYEAFYDVRRAGDFYGALGVSPLADEKTIKSRFRRLAAQHHPDKLQQASNGDGFGSPGSDSLFVYLKRAQDTLLDPARRYAYDRFGPDVAERREGQTMQDFIFTAMYKLAPEYLGGMALIILLNFTWWSQWGRFWRFYTFAALVTLELAMIVHPSSIFIPAAYLPWKLSSLLGISVDPPSFYLLPFQIIALARRASITAHIFISQVTPTRTEKPSSAPGSSLSLPILQRLGQLAQLSQVTENEATRLLQLGFAPFRGERGSVAALRRGMKEGLVLGGVRSSPGVKEAVSQVLRRRKAETEGDH
ncbi:hypothetical protein Egran_03706 [Elaphomyces granulatus]|uniref:J domain-containing protein n=1 Tax=Elaphomyces granulatus TaxID=519963 RepID=A0A232LWG6_9EURO|nr:hypothetical protein Egran_03706 [Elaphomyces granulatus]